MTKFGENDLGCIFDGANGQAYNDVRLIEMARSWGFNIDWAELTPDKWFTMGQDAKENYEFLSELSEEALKYLNDHMCQDGYAFEWFEGNLFFSELVKDEADNYLEFMEGWASEFSDTEVINVYNRVCAQIDEEMDKIDAARAELFRWEMSLRISEEQNVQIVTEIQKRGIYGNMDEIPEGPERYYCGTDLN